MPLAAPLMGWGVGAGIPAGMLGPGVSGVVHVPTSMVLTVVAWAARTAGRVPLGSVSVVPAALFALATWWVCRSTGVHRARLWAAALVGLVAWPGVAALSSPPQPDSGRAVERGVRVWTSAPRRPALSLAGITRSAQIVVVTYDADIGRLLAALREHRFGAIDILVVANGGRRQADLVRALRSRLSLGVVVVGDLAYGGGGAHVVRVKRATEATLGDLRLLVAPLEGGKLTVNITRVPGADSAA